MNYEKYKEKEKNILKEYSQKIKEIQEERDKLLAKNRKKFIKDNSLYKKGNIIKGKDKNIIKICDIDFNDDEGPSFVYFGDAFTTKLKPRITRPYYDYIFECNVIKKLK